MKAYLFSCGESTTEIAYWSLKRLGFDVIGITGPTTFYEKYLKFLELAKNETVVLRWDADVIATKELQVFVKRFLNQSEFWWMQGSGYCHLKHNIIPVSGNIMNRQVIHLGLKHMTEYHKASRPETYLSRCAELIEPDRRFILTNDFIGIHGFKQHERDIVRVMEQKKQRGQMNLWDQDLINELKKL